MRILPPLCCDGHFLERQWLPCEDLALLQDGGAVAEDEVDCAGDAALAVELPERVGVQGVLVSFHAAPEEGGLVGIHTEGDALVVFRPGGVSECDVPCDESLSGNRYRTIGIEKN